MGKIKSIEELEVFKRSHFLTLNIYKATEQFPQSEKFGLISQMGRASASIPTNLIEGSHRLSRKEFRQVVSISKGSAGELKYQILEVSKMLNDLIRSLSYTDTDTKHWHL